MAAARSIRRRRARNPWVRRLKRTGVFVATAFGLAVIGAMAVYIPIYQEASDDAANIEKRLIVNDVDPSRILSADGQILYSVAAIRRKVIDLTDPKYPSYVRYALVAAEDRRFFDHKGVDPIGLARAAYRHGSGGGGSTISMQLAKNLVNGDDRSIKRKLKDIATAQQIESLRSKDEILNLYANSSYFGEHAFGIERAAQIYFNKHADKLTVGEAAMLARCVRLPGRVNPVKSLKKMLPLRDYVLKVMLEENWITQGQYEEGIQEVPKIVHGQAQGQVYMRKDAGYFVRHVRSILDRDFPDVDLANGGYTIQTTLNMKLQERTVAAVNDTLREFRGDNVNDGAIVLMDAQGRILAEVGGPNYDKRQYNIITQGQGRQPGSAFKAIVYATAMKNGQLHPGDMLSNAPIHKRIGRNRYWNPQNASRKENASSYSLETAFALSVNRPAIHTIEEVGPKNVVAAGHDIFGIQSRLDPVESLALGTSTVKPIEMLEAYSVFMLGGDRVEPQPIAYVLGPGADQKHPTRVYDPVFHRAVLDPEVAKNMDEIMKGPVQYGTATYARDVPNARGKTGTTNDHKDAWFCGYSDGLVAVAWTGNTSKTGGQLQMGSGVFGGTVPVKIWTAVMEAAHNLNLAKGIHLTPGTTVSASAAPDEEADKPAAAEGNTDARPDAGAPKDKPEGPVTIDPAPDPNANSPDSDGNLPAKTDPKRSDPDRDPAQADPPKSDPPVTDPPVTPPDDPPVSDPPRRRHKEPAKEKEAEMVSVVVCVDTGLRATDYCPETVTRQFPKGRAPRKLCTMHHG